MELIKNKTFWLIIIVAILLVISFSFIDNGSYLSLIIVAGFLLLLIFLKYSQLGIYLIAFLYPFTYLEFSYQNAFNVPYVDMLALLLFIAFFIKSLYLFFEKGQKFSWKNFPAWPFMLLFVIAAFLSLLNVEREQLLMSLKYIFRPIIFFYLMYVILPFNIIDNLKKLFTTFKVMFVLGLSISLMGVWSIIIASSTQLKRATPTAIFGIYPLGTNQNLLAEVLICLIPFTLILYWYEKNIFLKTIYLIGAFFFAGVNLLTLSRAGWLALILEILILVALRYRKKAKDIMTSYLPYLGLLLIAPILYLMYELFASGFMATSNVNRLNLIELALSLFKSHPLIGNGVGTFIPLISQVKWYIIDYGEVIDAHGFIFKTLAETGILGTISFVLLLIYILYVLFKAFKENKNTKYSFLILGALLAASGGIVFQLFNTSYFIGKLWLPIGLALTCLKVSKTYFIDKNKLHAE